MSKFGDVLEGGPGSGPQPGGKKNPPKKKLKNGEIDPEYLKDLDREDHVRKMTKDADKEVDDKLAQLVKKHGVEKARKMLGL